MKNILWIEDIVESTRVPHFWPILELTWLIDFVDPCKTIAKMNAFLVFPTHKMKMKILNFKNHEKSKRKKIKG
jgi:hypothetical protein